MFKNILSKVGWGELPSSFGFVVGEPVNIPFSWHWALHKGQKKSDGSAVSIFVCNKEKLDPSLATAAKNAVQMAKSLRHTHILRAHDSIEVDSGFYLVTEECQPLLAESSDSREPAVWGLFQAFDALGFLHQSGFAHGLFGPGAVFVTPKGDFRLGAFDLCKKDADNTAMLQQRKRVGPQLMGWPEAPAHLAEGTAPTTAVDQWGAALLMAYVYSSAKSGRHGADCRVDMARAAQDIPPELRKPFESFCKPGPLRGRNPIVDATQLPVFQNNDSVRVLSFLGSLHIRSTEEKDAFFEGLPGMLDSMPRETQTKQVLPELMEAQKFPGQEAAQVLPAILKIGTKLEDEEFKAKVAPLVVTLFTSPDRAIRFRLLTSLGDMIDHLDDSMINDKIFPECVNGFTDSNGPIREATVKSLIFFVPRLKAKTVEGRIVKLLVKLMSDSEASIRTNGVICCGRISSHLPKAVANQTLMQVLTAGLKDSFSPCRNASLQTLMATATLFSAEELANRLLPAVCQRLVDPDPSVGDTAFNILSQLQQHVRQQVEELRASGGQEDAAPAAEETNANSWGSWAMSTVGKVVNEKMSGMMVAKQESEKPMQHAASSPHNDSSPATPAPPVARPPSKSESAAAPASRGGMNLGGASQSNGAKPAKPASSISFGDDDVGAVAAGGWGEEDNFWDDFGDKPEAKDEPEPVAAPAQQAAFKPAARAAPPRTVAPAAAAPATQAKAKPAAKPAAATMTSGKEDDDFWKEFEM